MYDYQPNLKFWTLPKNKRETLVKSFFLKRQNFLQKCSTANAKYDPLIKTVCSNYDSVNLANEGDRKKLKYLCKQIYCDGSPSETFCHKYNDVKREKLSTDEVSGDDIVKNIMKLIVMIVISVIIILMFLYNSKS